MDDTRKPDLEMLYKARSQANSTAERERYDKIAHKIKDVSAPIASMRQDLVGALRTNASAKDIKKINQRITRQKLIETHGNSMGNVKAEEIDKFE